MLKTKHLSLVAGALLLGVVGAARADITGSVWRSITWRATITAPANWHLSERTGYPNVLVRISRRQPVGELILAAEQVAATENSLGFATRTSKVLTEMGFSTRSPERHIATGAYVIDAQRGRAFLRQAYIVQNDIAYSLTLATSDARTRSQLLRAFDTVLRSLRPLTPAELAEPEPEPEQDREDSEDESPEASPSPDAGPPL